MILFYLLPIWMANPKKIAKKNSSCHLPTQLWEAVSKKHAKISSRKSKQVPSKNIALFTLPKPNLGR